MHKSLNFKMDKLRFRLQHIYHVLTTYHVPGMTLVALCFFSHSHKKTHVIDIILNILTETGLDKLSILPIVP